MDNKQPPAYNTNTSIMLDALKAPNKGTTIKIRDTGDILYNITVQSGFCEPTITDYKRESMAGKPYASFKGTSVYISESPSQLTGTKIKTRDFLYSNGFFKSSNRFLVQGVEYKLVSRGFGGTILELFPACEDKHTSQPLMKFKAVTGLFSAGDKRGEMTIFSNSISRDGNLVQHSLIHNGRPTWLLDLALIAESIWRANAKQKSSSAAAAGASAGAASAGGGGGGC